MIVKVIPSIEELMEVIKEGVKPDKDVFTRAVERCKSTMERMSEGIENGQMALGLSRESDSYYEFYYSLVNKDKTHNPSEINMGGRNTSQLVCNGAILVDKRNGEVSTHT